MSSNFHPDMESYCSWRAIITRWKYLSNPFHVIEYQSSAIQGPPLIDFFAFYNFWRPKMMVPYHFCAKNGVGKQTCQDLRGVTAGVGIKFDDVPGWRKELYRSDLNESASMGMHVIAIADGVQCKNRGGLQCDPDGRRISAYRALAGPDILPDNGKGVISN